jgi:hypothetical protein
MSKELHEAIVREALERAADETDFYSYDAGRDLRHLASDPEFVAAIISAAAQLNKERKGEALTSEARSDEEDRGMTDTFEYKGVTYDTTFGSNDTRHGGPFDRGSADSYYRRGYSPHYYVGGTHTSPLVPKEEMTKEEIQAYSAGYEYNETVTMDFKDWG